MESDNEQLFKKVKDKELIKLEQSIKKTEDYKKWDKYLLRFIKAENDLEENDFNSLLQLIKKEYITEIKRRFFDLYIKEFPYISYKDLDKNTIQLKDKEIKEAYLGRIKSSDIVWIYASLAEVESLSCQIHTIKRLVLLKTGKVLAIL